MFCFSFFENIEKSNERITKVKNIYLKKKNLVFMHKVQGCFLYLSKS